MLTVKDICDRLKITRVHLLTLRKDPELNFPQPIKVGARALRWREADLDAWIAAQ